MKTREDYSKEILAITNPNILLQLPTGFGKSKVLNFRYRFESYRDHN